MIQMERFESLADGETTTDTFIYTVDDGNGGTSTETVTITITGQNDAPVALDVAAAADEDGPTITINSIVNDVDNTNVFSFSIDDTGTLGLVTDNGDGTFSYDPNGQFEYLAEGETTTDTFTYFVDDQFDGSMATVTVTITGQNDAPVALAIAAAADEDGLGITITADFTDVDTSDTHTFTVDTALTLGSVVNNNDGTFTYDPNGAFEDLADGVTTTDTFTYTVDDGNGGTSTETVTITLTGGNDAPVALAIAAAATEGGASLIITADFTDVDTSDTHTFSVDTAGTLGSVVNFGDGTFDYDPNNGNFENLAVGEVATDTFTYTVDDGNGGTSTATVTVTITGTNDAPTVAAALTAAANEDDAGLAVDMLDGASDIDNGAVLAVANVTSLTAGVTFDGTSTINVDPSGAAFQSLAVGETLAIVVNYDVVDEHGASVAQSITITITGANDAPVVTGGNVVANISEDDALTVVDLLDGTNDFDLLDVLSVTNVAFVTGDVSGVIINGNTIEVDPSAYNYLSAGEVMLIEYSYDVIDGNGGVVSHFVEINITGTDDAAIVGGVTSGSVTEGDLADVESFLGTLNISDPDTSDLPPEFADIVATTGDNGFGTFELSAGEWTFILDQAAVEHLNDGDVVTDTFTFTASDGTTQQVDVTINGANNLFTLTNGIDLFNGSAGIDIVDGLDGADDIFGFGDDDILNGGAGADDLFGGAGDDILNGGDGNDDLTGGEGADVLNGGDGRDRLFYNFATSGVTVNLFDASLNTGEAAGDTYSSIESLNGSNFDDVLTSGNDNNDLVGLNGNGRTHWRRRT